MMMALLTLKSRLKGFYEKHYRILRCFGKAVLMIITLMIITSQLNYQAFLANHWIVLLLAVICAVTPDVASPLCAFLVTEIEVFQVSELIAVAILLIVLIYYLLFGRLANRQSVVLASVPVLSVLQISYLVPIVGGLFFSPVMIPALISSVFFYFVLCGVQEYALAASRMTQESTFFEPLKYLLDYLRGNLLLYTLLVAFVLTFICVYLIRRSKIQYASQIAILVGAILNLSILLFANIFLELNVDLLPMVVSIVVCVLIAYLIQFFRLTLDYHGTRKLQFEDDEYYYYVTAVPKIKVAAVDKTVTRIVPDEDDENQDLRSELEKELENDFNNFE